MTDTLEVPVFRCRQACVHMDGLPVLRDVDFSLRKGEFVALLGDNGAGKTTLVKVLLGLVPLGSGSLEIFGTPLRRFNSWTRIGYVPQRLGAISSVPATVGEVVLSGRASLAPWVPGYRRSDRAMVAEALEAVGLRESTRSSVRTLSGGQQQRVLIARALSRNPDVLLLDEPAAGIDTESQDALAGILARISREGGTVLMVAHGLGTLAELVSRTVVLDGGTVVYDGPPLGAPGGRGHLHIHHHPERPRPGDSALGEGVRPLP